MKWYSRKDLKHIFKRLPGPAILGCCVEESVEIKSAVQTCRCLAPLRQGHFDYENIGIQLQNISYVDYNNVVMHYKIFHVN